MIEIKNVYKNYGSKEVLNDINLTIKDGTTFGLIGINGAGKSTLLLLIAGVLQVDGGQILIDSIETYDHGSELKNMFLLPDEPPYNGFATFESLKELYRTFYDYDEKMSQKLEEIFKIDKKNSIHNMSKGMRRQVYITLAFSTHPKYLLLDEAFDGLDPLARLKFKEVLIDEKQKYNQTVIISSHSLRELEDICDEFGLISNGRFESYGNIDDEKDKVFKYQIILKEMLPNMKDKISLYNYYEYKIEGRILTIITKKPYDFVELNPAFVDNLEVTFEEYFIIKNKSEYKNYYKGDEEHEVE